MTKGRAVREGTGEIRSIDRTLREELVKLRLFLEQIHQDLDASKLGNVTAADLVIWKTEEGVTFIDGQCNMLR